MASPVTDPQLLNRLKMKTLYGDRTPASNDFAQNATEPTAPAPARKPVADPALVQRLDQKRMAPVAATKPAGKHENSFGENVGIGFDKRGLGTFQSAYTVAKTLGLIDADPDLEAVMQERRAELEKRGKGTGFSGGVEEAIGDPLDWVLAGDAANLARAGAGAAIRVGAKAVGKSAPATVAAVGGRALSAADTARATAQATAKASGMGAQGVAAAGRRAVTRLAAKEGTKTGAKYGVVAGLTNPTEDSKIGTRLQQVAESTAVNAAMGRAVPHVLEGVGNTARGLHTAATDIMAAGKSGMGRTPEQLEEALTALKDHGDTLFTQMRQNNVALTPQGGANMARGGIDAFKADRLTPRHPVTTEVLRDLVDQVQNGVPDAVNPAKRTPFDVVAFDTLRRRLGDAVGEDGAQAGKLRAAMFDAIQQPGSLNGSPQALDSLNMALQQWQKASRFQDVSKLANKANSDPNRIRTVVNNFTDKSQNTQGMLPDELEALQRAGKRTIGDKLLSLAGGVGVDMGSISRNPRAVVPYLLATGKLGAGAGVPGAAVPVAVGTVANSVRNRIANGKLEKVLRVIEDRPINVPQRAPAPPAAPSAPLQITGPTAPLALSAPPTVMVAPTGGVPAPASAVQRAEMYAHQTAPTPELEVPAAGAPRAPSTVQQSANDSVRSQFQNLGLTSDVLNAQRGQQVTAAEADKAIQDAAAQSANAAQLEASQPKPTIGDMLQQSQESSSDRAAATGQPAPELSAVGQALAKAVQANPAAAPTTPVPLRIDIHPHPSWWVPEDQLPGVNLPPGQ